MKADFQETRAALQHPGLKGASLEEILRQFLRQYLPQRLNVSTGILVDSLGHHSRQLDIIISDAHKTPIFYQSGETRVIPIECAYAVIEVKARLSPSELESIYENMRSVRTLQKQSFVQHPLRMMVSTYGGQWEIWPVNYFVFAFESSELMSLAEWIRSKHVADSAPWHQRIDTVCVLEKGVICNQTVKGMFDALPQPGANLFVCPTQRALLLFYALLSTLLNQAWLPDIQIVHYLGKMEFGSEVEV